MTLVAVRKRYRAIPEGVYLIGEIESAIRNLVVDNSDLLPRRSGKSKIKTDRFVLIDGISKYLLRILLMPNQVGERQLKGPRGKAFLWWKGTLLGFGADGFLEVGDVRRPSMEDFLYLDVLPDTPSTLVDNPDADDAYAYTASVVRKYMFCVDPETWSVRKLPLFSLDGFQEYVDQSGFPNRSDFEFQYARDAWIRVRKYAGAQIAFSFEHRTRPGEFRRPSEIARLVEKELKKLCATPGPAKEEILADAYLKAFRELDEIEQHSFTQAKARKTNVPGFPPFDSNSSKGFIKAWEVFKVLLSEEEFNRLPRPGRPKKPRT